MYAIRQWAFSICAAAIVCVLLQMLLPSFSVSKLARIGIALFFLCALLQPVGVGHYTGDWQRGSEQSLKQAQQYANALNGQLAQDVEGGLTAHIRQKLQEQGVLPHQYQLSFQWKEGQLMGAILLLEAGAGLDPAALVQELSQSCGVSVTAEYKEESK